MYKVFADDSLITVTPDITYANVSIDAFLDDLNYIRLNISLENIQGDIDIVSIRFMNSEECNPINDIERFSLKSNSFIIIPSMELERPADHLINGCKYEIRIEDDYQPTKIQTLVYEVPGKV
ncbi:hypothetical protein JTB14_009167 [Gonioctena quinquepunctata]|nr:hypothetical protein JTB14_009167 [Gonioctena quinquepunctata]